MQEGAELLGDEKLGKTRGEKSSPRKSPHMKRTKTTQATTQVWLGLHVAWSWVLRWIRGALWPFTPADGIRLALNTLNCRYTGLMQFEAGLSNCVASVSTVIKSMVYGI